MEIADKKIAINYEISLFTLVRRGVVVLVISLLVYFLNNSYQQNNELTSLNDVLHDSISYSTNKQGELVAKISAFETQRTQDFLTFKTKDSLTIELQKDVKRMSKYLKKQGSVTNFSTSTDIVVSEETEVIDLENKYPTYKSHFDLEGWIIGSTIASRDSTQLRMKVKNEYSLVIGLEPKGFLGLGTATPFAEVTNKNPYSTVKTLKTYNVTYPKPKRFGVGPYIGLDARGIISGGVSVNYSLIQF